MEIKTNLDLLLEYMIERKEMIKFVVMRCRNFVNNIEDTRDWNKFRDDIWQEVHQMILDEISMTNALPKGNPAKLGSLIVDKQNPQTNDNNKIVAD